MQASLPCLFYLPFFCILLISANAMVTAETDALMKHQSTNFNLGVIIDYRSRAGKEQKVAMEIAKVDFYAHLSHRLNLHIRDSGHDLFRAVSSAKALIEKHHVRAILGLDKCEEAVLVAELGNESKIPILSLANEVPLWGSKLCPFLVNAARSDYAQMKAVAAIVQTWQWRRVTVIYEDINSAITGIIPYLIAALQEVDSVIYELLPLPPLPSNYSLSDELENLKSGQCRVFIVHTSIRVAANLFMQAKNMGMMDKEYVWITTNEVTSQIDSLNATVISSMQGVLGVRSYFSCTGIKYNDFQSKFQAMFKLQYPNESYPGPGIFALQAYDALWAVALAMENVLNLTDLTSPMVSMSGHQLLDIILKSNFEGLTGRFNFVRRVLTPTNIFGLLNVVGKSYNELGYWSSEGLGFSKHVGEGTKYNKSMRVLGQVIWPGGSEGIPRGWALPTRTNQLIIGVPASPAFSEFVKVENHTSNKTIVTGFSIDVFKATLDLLPYNLPHKFVSYDGHYDDLIQQVQLKNFDAVVGDTAIVAKRCEYAEFSQPYSQSGLQMLIYVKYRRPERAWLFQKPFTSAMWAFTGVLNVYNGFVVWLIERRHNPRFRGTLWNQIGTLISLAFTTLFSLQGERLHSNLSRMTMIVWLFVALVITQSYTASLTSLLTLQGLNPVAVDVETLKMSGAKVGCDANSFIVKYLEDVIGFHSENIVGVRSGDNYTTLLKNRSIAAAFLQIPYVKVFLAKNCNGFATSGETIKVGGFGFVFPKGAPMLPDISEAVLKISETGILSRLETTMLNSFNCSASSESDDDHDRLGVSSFLGLFMITTGTSTFAFLVFIFRHARPVWPILRNFGFQEQRLDLHVHNPEEDESSMFAWGMENRRNFGFQEQRLDLHVHNPEEDESSMFACEMENQDRWL